MKYNNNNYEIGLFHLESPIFLKKLLDDKVCIEIMVRGIIGERIESIKW